MAPTLRWSSNTTEIYFK